ncbi:dihydroneopterin aldolase [Roseitranquillus sediminis]|uniref:dihydroneopterin aldolase n=1 Tax=Roseitranquillus sediminis TaxID=2809051 RepID=UPI001D0BF63D|nr:dihydroneopterin aldolase [Roseitranquillus sediminis]MBM9594677.1 dihydroneopterin aldolase [Roseitranquillus sediminis]
MSEHGGAGAGGGTSDRIFLADHVVEAEIGAFEPERGRLQRLRFGVWVDLRSQDPAGDDVDRIVSYDTLTDAIAQELGAERLNLLETLAERIAARVLREPRAAQCRVRIEKLDRGPGALGVEIERSAPAVASPARPEAPRPVVVHLSDEAASSPRLPDWIAELHERPPIFCVGFGPLSAPRVEDEASQRRIDLLAIEINARAVAARIGRCTVTSSRTELGWALRHERLTVWAPAKMVLDTPSAPIRVLPTELTAWFAREMDAERLLYVGEDPPQGVRAEVRAVTAPSLLA